jgi:hypothetical protein
MDGSVVSILAHTPRAGEMIVALVPKHSDRVEGIQRALAPFAYASIAAIAADRRDFALVSLADMKDWLVDSGPLKAREEFPFLIAEARAAVMASQHSKAFVSPVASDG